MSTKNTKRLFCDNELFGIESTFHFRTGDRCLTEDILKRHSKIEEGLRCNVGSDLKEFHIEECRLFPGDDDMKLLDSTSAADSENEQHIESSDSETDNFGLSYVCTQLLDFNEQDTGDSMEASDDDKMVNKRKHKTVDDLDKLKTSQKCKQSRECDDESVDCFLDVLLGLTTSTNTSKKHKSSSEVKDAEKSEERTSKSGDSKQTATEVFEDDKSDDILGDLWQEMESVNQTVVKANCKGTAHTIPLESNTQNKHAFIDCLHSSDKLTNNRFPLVQQRTVQNSEKQSDKARNKHKQLHALHTKSGLHSAKQRNSQKVFKRMSEISKTKQSPETKKPRIKTSTECLGENDEGNTGKDVREQSVTKTLGNTFESITDVFAECGVIHMHQNQKVTGTSKAEDYMSRCAISDVFENYCNTQVPAVICKPTRKLSKKRRNTKARKCAELQTSASTKCNSNKKALKPKQELGFFYGPRSLLSGGKKILIGQTPKAIKRQHFLKLARYIEKKSDAEDAVKFAKKVLCSKRTEHIHWLEMFYRNGLGLKDIIPTQKDNM